MAMDQGLGGGLEGTMGVIDRVAAAVTSSGVRVDERNIESVVASAIQVEAPLAGAEIRQGVIDALMGLGPLERLLRIPDVTDVFVNGPDEIWIDRSGRLEPADCRFPDGPSIRAAVERIITPLGLRLDHASPIVDARLVDGSRLHAVIPPASPDGPVVAIRRFTQAVKSQDDLVRSGMATTSQAQLLSAMVSDRVDFVVSGATGSGKTTLLNVIGSMIDPCERVVVVEDAAELALPGHVVRLEAQPANADGAGRVTLSELVRSALRLRPDRIVIGEVRGDEALDLVNAMNTGHAGSLSTVHANSPEHALWRIETLALSGQRRVSELAVRRQVRDTITHAVQLTRRGGDRRITHLGRIE
jgi:pilus assembly protein CpaF